MLNDYIFSAVDLPHIEESLENELLSLPACFLNL